MSRAKRLTWGRRLSGLLAVGVIGLAVALLHRYLHAMRWHDFALAWQALSARAIVASVAATCVSFGMLAAFEMQAARLGAGHRISLRRAAFAGVVANAIGNMLGFHAITASAVRYRIYGAAGLGVGDTARIVGIAGLGVGLGFVVVITGALVWQPTIVAGWGRWPGLGLLLALAAWLVWLGRSARTLRVAGWSLRFPDARAAASQMLIGAVEMCGAIAALHVLLPASVAPPFVDFLPVYVAAVLAGLLSHAPGGLGVFESILLAAFPQAQRPEVLAAILCYRLTYTIGPFVLGSLAFGAFEGRLRWRSRRAPTVARRATR